MSACLKIDFDDEYAPAAGGDPQNDADRHRESHLPTRRPLAWWHRALHCLALLGFLGFCALLGLLWFSLAIEAG